MDSLHAFSEIQHTLGYLAPEYVAQVEKAFYFAKKAHFSQSRLSGGPYISHPLQVAEVLALLKLDHHTIIAGLLHDVVEDTAVTLEEVVEEFGEDVATIVDGVTKISKVKYQDLVAYQAENYRKMFMAMTKDVRVIFVKLADRLHNMRTCQVMALASKRRIAKETMDVYAPLAKRLGMHNMSQELYELSFAACYPIRYLILLDHMYRANSVQADVLAHLTNQIKTQAKAQGIKVVDVSFREKKLFGIYQKMRLKQARFSDLMDVYALRICVESVTECYQLLGIVHSLYQPKFRLFKDYIASPKSNGYRSIHTVLFGPYDMPIEIQIRTTEMHLVATKGVAAHWVYKLGTSISNQQKQQDWFKRLVKAQQVCSDNKDYLSLVKHQLFEDQVYVLTPKGKVFELKKGATVLDFAYQVHTDIGHSCIAAEVDRVQAPLHQALMNGQTVRVYTDSQCTPCSEWLGFVTTAKARSSIKQFLKDNKMLTERKIGQQILSAALKIRGFEGPLSQKVFHHVAEVLQVPSSRDLFEKLALGSMKVDGAMDQYFAVVQRGYAGNECGSMLLNAEACAGMIMAKCCYPVHGDKSCVVKGSKGMEVHRSVCRGVDRAPDSAVVRWDESLNMFFESYIRVEMADGGKSLAYVIAMIVDMRSSVLLVRSVESSGVMVYHIKVTVESLSHLMLIIQSLNQIKMVHTANREIRCGLLSSAQG
ncbi:RelA/SpoT family protein [Candidatus Synchoanobacter obligatus]|uniref:RelA/SpoT family protein n=1 Tax=Candidatus Synchoanobacter obligatus TaxID=2919597 RepID=A0ABT1L595_9GAMM|nr:RelA/SpoT family protein [Candidatus Synchoanobacter obligatus]MCP8352347.1 RelA/SpoT family protein [Candidatus Synchoanobacter obligatus]